VSGAWWREPVVRRQIDDEARELARQFVLDTAATLPHLRTAERRRELLERVEQPLDHAHPMRSRLFMPVHLILRGASGRGGSYSEDACAESVDYGMEAFTREARQLVATLMGGAQPERRPATGRTGSLAETLSRRRYPGGAGG
jgi:hypothetical protein